MIDEYKQIFVEEASDLLTDLEISLLDLERRHNDEKSYEFFSFAS